MNQLNMKNILNMQYYLSLLQPPLFISQIVRS